MLIQRANKYCAEPTPYQAKVMSQWIGACRFVSNIGLGQRIDAWRRRGVRRDHNQQAKELTARREIADWLDFTPGHALQYALMHVENAFARFRSGQHEHPKPCKKFRNDAFALPGEDVEFRRHGRDFCCRACGFAGHADIVAAINVSQARALAVEPPKPIRTRVGKRKPLEFKHAA